MGNGGRVKKSLIERYYNNQVEQTRGNATNWSYSRWSQRKYIYADKKLCTKNSESSFKDCKIKRLSEDEYL